jgi:hypothetical protein
LLLFPTVFLQQVGKPWVWRPSGEGPSSVLRDQHERVTVGGAKEAKVALVEGQDARDLQSLGDGYQDRINEIDLSVGIATEDGCRPAEIVCRWLHQSIGWFSQSVNELGHGRAAHIALEQVCDFDDDRCRQEDNSIESGRRLADGLMALLRPVQQSVEKSRVQQVTHG